MSGLAHEPKKGTNWVVVSAWIETDPESVFDGGTCVSLASSVENWDEGAELTTTWDGGGGLETWELRPGREGVVKGIWDDGVLETSRVSTGKRGPSFASLEMQWLRTTGAIKSQRRSQRSSWSRRWKLHHLVFGVRRSWRRDFIHRFHGSLKERRRERGRQQWGPSGKGYAGEVVEERSCGFLLGFHLWDRVLGAREALSIPYLHAIC